MYGVYEYDGSTWIDRGSPFADISVSSICKDLTDRIWIVSDKGEVACFDGGSWQSFPFVNRFMSEIAVIDGTVYVCDLYSCYAYISETWTKIPEPIQFITSNGSVTYGAGGSIYKYVP